MRVWVNEVLRPTMRWGALLAALLGVGCLELPQETLLGPTPLDTGPPSPSDPNSPDVGQSDAEGVDASEDQPGFDGGRPVSDGDGFVLIGDAGVSVSDATPPDLMPEDWYDPAWRARKKLRLYAVRVSQAVNDVPLLVRLRRGSDPSLAAIRPDARDLLFVSANQQVLAHEIEWVSDDVVDVWVKVPRVEALDADQFLWMYFDSDRSAPPVEDSLWSDYAVVLHMSGPAEAPFEDASGNATPVRAIDPTGGISQSPGVSGRAFSGSGNGTNYLYLNVGGPGDGVVEYSVSLSVYQPSLVMEGREVLLDCIAADGTRLIRVDGARYILETCSEPVESLSVDVWSRVGWHHVTLSWQSDGRESTEMLVVDGHSVGTRQGLGVRSPFGFVDWRLGRDFGGPIDEVRLARGDAVDVNRDTVTQLSQLEELVAFGERAVHPSGVGPREARAGGVALEFDFEDAANPFQGAGPNATELRLEGGQEGDVAYLGGGVRFLRPVLYKSRQAPRDLIGACGIANAITVEAWVMPENTLASGPARVFTLSKNIFKRYFSLLQMDDTYIVRLRTTESTQNGIIAYAVADPDAGKFPAATANPRRPRQIAFAFQGAGPRGADSRVTFFVDGREVKRQPWPGELSEWLDDTGTVGEPRDMRLGLGNQIKADTDGLHTRPWLGSVYHLAVYCRALNEGEIRQNFQAGY